MKIGSFCSGVGALDLAVEAVTGGEVVWHAETDRAASLVLDERWPGVPNHGDLRFHDWSKVEPVDVICAGFPCQPISQAGRQAGTADKRWLWDDIAAAIRRMATRPRWAFLENVPRLLTIGGGVILGRILHDLAHLGYVGRYRLLSAASVGAPHLRKRWFLVAHADGEGWEGFGSDAQGESQGPWLPGGEVEPAPHAHGGGRLLLEERHVGTLQPEQSTPLGDDPDGLGLFAFGEHQAAIDRWGGIVGRPPPPPLERERFISPRFSEWMMGLPEGWVTDLVTERGPALRCLGNGAVPLQAGTAYRSLLA